MTITQAIEVIMDFVYTIPKDLVDRKMWDYCFDNPDHQLYKAFGWNGGTIHQWIDEVLRIKKQLNII
jgi:hypothetical protein